MLKKIWQSWVRWFRKLFKQKAARSIVRASTIELPPLDDTDREYLFMQLLEGVAHGWQQPRAIGFFNKIRQRVRKSDWLEWLERFGNNLIEAPLPNYELADRLVKLGELDCGEIGDLAGEYGVRLLSRQAEELSGGLLPIMEFDTFRSLELEDAQFDLNSDQHPDQQFPELPLELLIDNDPTPSPPARSFTSQPEEDATTETREITLEEFSAMLQKDPDLVAELAEQFGIQTTDPQEIVNIVISQMQQQVQISGDLTPPTDAPNSPLTATADPSSNDSLQDNEPSSPPLTSNSHQTPPPPPPSPKLEYNQEDPWNHPAKEGSQPETANTPDRGV
jgi:hypothetical protein